MGYGIGKLGVMTPQNLQAAQGFMRNAISASAARSDKMTTPEEPGKSIGGGLMAGMGGAAAGASVGSMIAPGVGTAWGAAIGGVVGMAAYGLS